MGGGTGGDVVNVFITRPDGSSRSFTVATGGDNPRINGGVFAEEVEANGDSSVRKILRNRPGERELILSIDDKAGDHEWMLEASADPEFSTVSYTHISGTVYSHKASPTGDMSKNDGNSTLTVTFKGSPINPE